jgi:tetratricopeptide (TPR) repeat protein
LTRFDDGVRARFTLALSRPAPAPASQMTSPPRGPGELVEGQGITPTGTAGDVSAAGSSVRDRVVAVAVQVAEVNRAAGGAVSVEQLAADVEVLAVLGREGRAPGEMFVDAERLFQDSRWLLADGARPGQSGEVLLAGGTCLGIMSYAALDLGQASQAHTYARGAYRVGDRLSHDGLRAWARGTQSLISRFQGQFSTAYRHAMAGGEFAGHGTAAVRLSCQRAQCLANLGDPRGAHAALDRAAAQRDRAGATDGDGALFDFSPAKQTYYAASSLIWLDGPAHATRAAVAAEEAIELFERGGETGSDQSLARIYLAIARLQLDDLEGAVQACSPILDLPPEQQISWILLRLGRVHAMINSDRYRTAPLAREASEQITTLLHQTPH